MIVNIIIFSFIISLLYNRIFTIYSHRQQVHADFTVNVEFKAVLGTLDLTEDMQPF